MLFGVQGEFDHTLQEIVCLQPGKIVTNQFFADQAALNPLVSDQESGDRGFKPHARRAWLHLGLGWWFCQEGSNSRQTEDRWS